MPAFVGDEVTDRFCVLGSVDEHIAKLHELADAGVDQFNIYLMNGDEEGQLEAYGRSIVPSCGTWSRPSPEPFESAGHLTRIPPANGSGP